MPNIPAAGHWRLLYLPYFAATEGWAVQIAVGAVENSGLCWRKARGADWQPWEFAATATPPEEIPLQLAEGVIARNRCFYRKDQFGVVSVHADVDGQFGTGGGLISTLPAGFIPATTITMPAFIFTPGNFNSLSAGSIEIDTRGNLYGYSPDTGGKLTLCGEISYLA